MKILVSGLIWLLASQYVYAAYYVDPDLVWHTAKTEHFHIHYHSELSPLIPDVAKIAEQAHQRITPFFNWAPDDPTQLILIDRIDTVNGFAFPMPRNTMTIFVSPPDDIDVLGDYHDWLDLVISHEYTHIVHIDKASGIPYSGRSLFGRFLLFFPNLFQPLWLIEGLATYSESQLYPDIGRGRNSAFRSIMRLEIASGIKPLSFVNMPVVTWPSGNARYLYGVYFFNYLVSTYGVEKVKAWIQDYSNNLIPFTINNNATASFGKNMDSLWSEFSRYLQEQFQPEIDRIKEQGLTEGTRITHSGYFTGFPRTDGKGNVYYFQRDLLSESKLMKLTEGTNSPEPITDIYSGRFDVHPEAGILVSQLDNYKNTNLYADLYIIDPATGSTRQITEGQRYKFATWSPDGQRIAAVQTINGQSRLHLLSADGKFLETLWEGENKVVISALDWSQETLVATIWRPGSHWNLELFNLQQKQWKKLLDTGVNEYQAQFSHDGKFIYFSADTNGVYNIFRFDNSSGDIVKLTNVLGSAVSASPAANGNGLYYMGFNEDGSDIYYLPSPKAIKTESQETMVPSATGPLQALSTDTKQADPTILVTENYTALDKISPTTWFPYLNFNDEKEEFGFSTSGSDPLFRHNYILLAGYDFKNNWGVGLFDYRYDRWDPSVKFFAKREVKTIFDNNDDVDSYRNHDTLTLELLFPYLKRDFQWTFHIGASLEEQSDKKLVTRTFKVDDARDQLLGIAWTLNTAKQFPRGISLQDGQKLRLVYEDSDAMDSDFTGQVGTMDWRGYFSLYTKQVLATRLVIGYGNESPNPFRLGGTQDGFALPPPGAALIEPTEEVINKRSYALRGYPEGLANLTGRRMFLANLEYRFPIALIERTIMAPPIGLHQVHGSLFYSAADAWNEGSNHDDLSTSVGLELNTEMVFGYFIPIIFRLGLAHGIDEGGDDEAYIEVGGSF